MPVSSIGEGRVSHLVRAGRVPETRRKQGLRATSVPPGMAPSDFGQRQGSSREAARAPSGRAPGMGLSPRKRRAENPPRRSESETGQGALLRRDRALPVREAAREGEVRGDLRSGAEPLGAPDPDIGGMLSFKALRRRLNVGGLVSGIWLRNERSAQLNYSRLSKIGPPLPSPAPRHLSPLLFTSPTRRQEGRPRGGEIGG
jgi:hypothetical protein